MPPPAAAAAPRLLLVAVVAAIVGLTHPAAATIAHTWTLNEGSGTVAVDSANAVTSSDVRNMTLGSSSAWLAASLAKEGAHAVSIGGSATGILKTANQLVNGPSDETRALWVYLNATVTRTTTLFATVGDSDSAFCRTSLDLDSMSTVTFRDITSSGEIAQVSANVSCGLALGAWHHIAVTRTAENNTVCLFVNATQLVCQVMDFLQALSEFETYVSWQLGGSDRSCPEQVSAATNASLIANSLCLTGYVDDAHALWEQALTASEVASTLCSGCSLASCSVTDTSTVVVVGGGGSDDDKLLWLLLLLLLLLPCCCGCFLWWKKKKSNKSIVTQPFPIPLAAARASTAGKSKQPRTPRGSKVMPLLATPNSQISLFANNNSINNNSNNSNDPDLAPVPDQDENDGASVEEGARSLTASELSLKKKQMLRRSLQLDPAMMLPVAAPAATSAVLQRHNSRPYVRVSEEFFF